MRRTPPIMPRGRPMRCRYCPDRKEEMMKVKAYILGDLNQIGVLTP